MMIFKELLGVMDEFSGEVICNNEETQFSFEWYKTKFTEVGKKRFKELLNSKVVKITSNNVVFIENEKVTSTEYNLFMSAIAGYVSVKEYDKWFAEGK